MVVRSPDPDFGTKVLTNAFSLWFTPELERRQKRGSLPDGFRVIAAQVVLFPDKPAEVRFNEEVRAQLGFEHNPDSPPVVVGKPVVASQVKTIKELILLQSDGDAAHFTAICLNNSWHIHFDFRYSASTIAGHLRIARQFIKVARLALEAECPNAAVENLFAGAELLAKCVLLEAPDSEIQKGKKHRFVRSKFNLRTKQGIVPPEWSSLLNRLHTLRPLARYGIDHAQDLSVESEALLKVAEAMLVCVDESRPKRATGPDVPTSSEGAT